MDTEPKTIRLQIDADPRLAAAVGGAARYLADAAGMENEAIAQLQSAVIAACREAFGHLSEDHPHLDVSLTRLSDRIEVSLSHEGATVRGRRAGMVGKCRAGSIASSTKPKETWRSRASPSTSTKARLAGSRRTMERAMEPAPPLEKQISCDPIKRRAHHRQRRRSTVGMARNVSVVSCVFAAHCEYRRIKTAPRQHDRFPANRRLSF